MKKRILFAFTIAIGSSILLMNGCKKDEDTKAPVVSLNGGDMTFRLNNPVLDIDTITGFGTGVVNITTSVPHFLVEGETVTLLNILSSPAFTSDLNIRTTVTNVISSNTFQIAYNYGSGTYSSHSGQVAVMSLDPGAKTDDGSAVTSTWGPLNPNLGVEGVYTIIYSATDHDGNMGTVSRSVTVKKNDVQGWIGTYARANIIDSVFDDAGYTSFNSIYTWSNDMTVASSNAASYRWTFYPFADNMILKDKVAGIAAGPDTSGSVMDIPFQPIECTLDTYTFTGYPDSTMTFHGHIFQGNGNYYIASSSGIKLAYSDLDFKIFSVKDSATATIVHQDTTVNILYHIVYFNR